MKYENPAIKNEINKITQTGRKTGNPEKQENPFFYSYVIISIHDGFNRKETKMSHVNFSWNAS